MCVFTFPSVKEVFNKATIIAVIEESSPGLTMYKALCQGLYFLDII